MAKPRVFISSTFYDLRQIRLELDKFIEGLGYEPVRNEEGDIPYGKDNALQDYCYKEITNVDILISIIGSRYGSPANNVEKNREYSISQMELKTALEDDKQVFVFIDKNVNTEYETYLLNKGNGDIKYKYVDNPNIYKFIDEIRALPNNNNIKSFETADDITHYLKEQFAGLFKQYIIDNKRIKETLIIKDIENTVKTLREMIDYLRTEDQDKNEVIRQIIKINHPLIGRLKSILNIQYKFYIEDRTDLRNLLISRGYRYNIQDNTWNKEQNNIITSISISDDLFDEEGKLKDMKAVDWNDDFLKINSWTQPDDLPF